MTEIALPHHPSSSVVAVKQLSEATLELDALLLGAGFEDRAFKTLSEGVFKAGTHCLLVRFVNDVPDNQIVFERYLAAAQATFGGEQVHIIELRHDAPQQFEGRVAAALLALPRTVRTVGFELSGMPSYGICAGLKAIRDHRAEERQVLFYTSALEYNPTFEEYRELSEQYPDEIERLPRRMALEMNENLILDSFSGYRSQNARSCLALFAGFEAHRSTGVVEAVNPSLLLLLYGNPGDAKLSWRLELARKLHRKFERGRRAATEVVSTLHFEEALQVLEQYYNFLIDDYDLVLTPVGSKMQAVAAYLFWERYNEVQLTFPIPIGYDPTHGPKGAGTTYVAKLPPRMALFRSDEDVA